MKALDKNVEVLFIFSIGSRRYFAYAQMFNKAVTTLLHRDLYKLLMTACSKLVHDLRQAVRTQFV